MTVALSKNVSSNGWIVQKFGGTSVGKFPDNVRGFSNIRICTMNWILTGLA